MSDQRTPEPRNVIAMVEDYVRRELSDAEKFENRSPLDESGIWDLHALAAEIYAAGWRDGDFAAGEKERQSRARERDAEAIAAAPADVAQLLGVVARLEDLADWHDTKADKAHRFRPEIDGENRVMDKAAEIHKQAAARIRAALKGGESDD